MTMRSNCLVFALCRWFHRGGYLIIRKSRYGWFPHFLWSPDLNTFHSFKPINPRERIIPPLIFRGAIHETEGDTKWPM
jgi:hypothetical protein